MRRKPLRLLVIYWLSHACLAQAPADCDALTGTASDETLIVWNAEGPVVSRRGPDGEPRTEYGRLRAMAVVAGDEIREPRNAVLERGESLWNVLDAGQELVLSEAHSLSFLVRPGDSYCLFSAQAESSNVEAHALFTNDPAFRLRRPTVSEQAEFRENIYPVTYCVNRQGLFLRDVSPEDIPPCDAPQLIGLSDVNGNSEPEYWATDILRHSTGIAVWEYGPSGYVRIFSACPGCPD